MKLCTSILAIPFLEVLLRTVKCSDGTLDVIDGMSCWSSEHIPMAVIGILFTVLALGGSIVLIS